MSEAERTEQETEGGNEADARAGDEGADAQEPPLRVVVPAAGLVFEDPDGRLLLSLRFSGDDTCLSVHAPESPASVSLYVQSAGATVCASAGGPVGAYLHGFPDLADACVTGGAGEIAHSLRGGIGEGAQGQPPREEDPAEQADLAALLVLTAGTVLH